MRPCRNPSRESAALSIIDLDGVGTTLLGLHRSRRDGRLVCIRYELFPNRVSGEIPINTRGLNDGFKEHNRAFSLRL